jgi:hypothetical protein
MTAGRGSARMSLVRRLACTALLLALLVVPPVTAAGPLQFSGTGNRTLAPFTLAHASTLRWQTSGGLLGGLLAVKLLNTRAEIPNQQLVFSKARTGSVRLPAGRYVLRIDALPGTRWELTIG